VASFETGRRASQRDRCAGERKRTDMAVWFRLARLIGAAFTLPVLASCGREEAPPPEIRAPVFAALPGTNNFSLVVPRTLNKDRFPVLAKEQCKDRSPCAIYAWVAPDQPARSLPPSERELMTQAYSYVANRESGFELSLWNCLMYNREDRDECMPHQQPE
jgi:hypothetical protein